MPQKPLITLRRFELNDIDDLLEWATDDLVTKFMMWDTYTSKSQAQDFFHHVIKNHEWFRAICLGKKVIGTITLEKGKGAHSCKAELGYVLSRVHWGQGYASEAVQIALKTGFIDLQVERIEAYVDPANVASMRVLEKSGFTREGLLRKSILQKGVIQDRLLYSFLKSP